MAEPIGMPARSGGPGADLDELRAAWRELNDVVREIQQVPGYEHFMAAPTFADVAAAAEQPLCYISAAETEGLALVVRNNGGTVEVDHVPLPSLTADALRTRANELVAARKEFRRDNKTGYAPWAAELDGSTYWLWETIMGGLLERLRGVPAVTLVPGGLLGLLPLHAASTPETTAPTGRAYALDHVTISYAPNARSLTAARKIADQRPVSTLLAVVQPQPLPSGYPAMPFTALEATAAEQAISHALPPLAGTAATRAAVLRELPASDVVHLACHGFAELNNPLDSGIVLAGGEVLRVRDLLAMDLRIRLVVLPACETSLPGTELPDEVVALPTALLQAGAAGVVAPLWAIPDMATAMVMTEFYRRWPRDGRSPADALRRAQIWVRDTTNAEKSAAWEQALDDDSGWPPPDVADALLDHVLQQEPDRRDQAHVAAWGAFGHVGV